MFQSSRQYISSIIEFPGLVLSGSFVHFRSFLVKSWVKGNTPIAVYRGFMLPEWYFVAASSGVWGRRLPDWLETTRLILTAVTISKSPSLIADFFYFMPHRPCRKKSAYLLIATSVFLLKPVEILTLKSYFRRVCLVSSPPTSTLKLSVRTQFVPQTQGAIFSLNRGERTHISCGRRSWQSHVYQCFDGQRQGAIVIWNKRGRDTPAKLDEKAWTESDSFGAEMRDQCRHQGPVVRKQVN